MAPAAAAALNDANGHNRVSNGFRSDGIPASRHLRREGVFDGKNGAASLQRERPQEGRKMCRQMNENDFSLKPQQVASSGVHYG